jgi:hypothetical protein
MCAHRLAKPASDEVADIGRDTFPSQPSCVLTSTRGYRSPSSWFVFLLLFLLWLTMPQARKQPQPTKSKETSHDRRLHLAEAIASLKTNRTMVKCEECVSSGDKCFYERGRTWKCAACIKHQRECSGTFDMEEFRKAGDEKKRMEAETRKHRREVTRLRKLAKERQAEATKEIARLRREAEEAVLLL